MDINKDEFEVLYVHLKKYLKHFEQDPIEQKFWNDTYNLNALFVIRDKLKKGLEFA